MRSNQHSTRPIFFRLALSLAPAIYDDNKLHVRRALSMTTNRSESFKTGLRAERRQPQRQVAGRAGRICSLEYRFVNRRLRHTAPNNSVTHYVLVGIEASFGPSIWFSTSAGVKHFALSTPAQIQSTQYFEGTLTYTGWPCVADMDGKLWS